MFISKKKIMAERDAKFNLGWLEGFGYGTKKAITEARKVFIKRIQKEIREVSSMVDKEFIDGLERAIELIKKDK